MFSKTVEYALRAVVHLAYEAPHARTTEQIAEATRVDPSVPVQGAAGPASWRGPSRSAASAAG